MSCVEFNLDNRRHQTLSYGKLPCSRMPYSKCSVSSFPFCGDGFTYATDDTHSPELDNRERQRQRSVNQAFLDLRALLPTYPPDKKLSKHEILRLSIKYIRVLEAILRHQEMTNE